MTEVTPSRWIVLPPHVLLAAIFTEVALDRWLPIAELWGSPGGYVGATIIVLALGVNIYCALQLRRRRTTIIPFRVSTELMTDGLFRYSRNPIYVSMAVLLVGLAILLGSMSPWFVPPIFIAVIDAQFIRREEEMLAETFGQAYNDYCSRVRRWL